MRLEAFLRYAGWLAGAKRGTRTARLDEVLNALNLQEYRRQQLGKLSGGTVRRAGLAAVLMGDPQLLLLDEPTTGVDPVERVAMRRIIAEQAEQRTVVLSSHIAEDIQELSDHVLILESGRRVFFGGIERLHPEGSARDFEQTLLSYTGGAGNEKSSGKPGDRP